MYWVHGRHGEDPFAGSSSREYPFPPVAHAPRIQELSDGMEKLGLHPFHVPMGIALTEDAEGRATPQSRCIRCDRVDGFPCLMGAKADAEWVAVRPALAAHQNLTLLTGATVQKLVTDPAGRTVTGVVTAMPDGSMQTFTGDIVVLSAGSILSAVMLLRLGERPAPARAGQLLRRGRPPLHAAQQPRPQLLLEGPQPDRLPEDPVAERLLRAE